MFPTIADMETKKGLRADILVEICFGQTTITSKD
jgi:hypothetical protein